MEPTFEPNSICCLRQLFSKTIRQEETAEVSVPDGEADPERVLACYANVVLRSKECRTGSAELSGGIQAEVLYLPTGQAQPRTLPVYLPFTAIVDHAQMQPESRLVVCACLRSAEARIVHSRRIQVRAALTLLVRAYRDCEETIPRPAEKPDTLQLKTVVYPMLLPVDCAETSLRVAETLALPENADPQALCCCTAEPVLTESKVTGDKAVFQGELRLHLLYGTQDGAPAVYDRKLPFSQYCELGDVYENAEADFCVLLTGCELQPVGEEITFTADLLAQCTVYARIPVALCEDAYAVRGDWQPEWKDCDFRGRLDRQELGGVMRESAETPVGSVLDVTVFRDSPTQEREGDRLRLLVPMTAQILYYDREGALQRCLLRGKAETETQLSQDAVCEVSASPQEASVQYTASGLTVSCPVDLTAESYADRAYRTIVGGTLREESGTEKRPAVILRRAAAGESLWDMAKQYRSTVEKIARANRIREDHLTEPMTVLIPT